MPRPAPPGPVPQIPPRVAERESAVANTTAVASFPTYDSAANAVARLAGTGFQIEQITIVGCDLRLVEEVTGRMTTWRAATMGAITGAWFGALVAVLVGIFAGSFGTFAALVLWGIVLGALFGGALGAVGHRAYDRDRGFTSTRLVVARRYDLHAPPEAADELRASLLAHRPTDVRLIDGNPMR
jgi:hypothetical protein